MFFYISTDINSFLIKERDITETSLLDSWIDFARDMKYGESLQKWAALLQKSWEKPPPSSKQLLSIAHRHRVCLSRSKKAIAVDFNQRKF